MKILPLLQYILEGSQPHLLLDPATSTNLIQSLILLSVYDYEASVMDVYSSIEEYQRFLEDLYNNFEQQLNEAKSEKLAPDS